MTIIVYLLPALWYYMTFNVILFVQSLTDTDKNKKKVVLDCMIICWNFHISILRYLSSSFPKLKPCAESMLWDFAVALWLSCRLWMFLDRAALVHSSHVTGV